MNFVKGDDLFGLVFRLAENSMNVADCDFNLGLLFHKAGVVPVV